MEPSMATPQEQERIADYELIAKFMGLIRRDANKLYGLPQWWKSTPDKRERDVFMGYPHQLKYDKSWNWLMPVVEEIESLMYQVDIHTACTNINGQHSNGAIYNQDTPFETQEETKLIVTCRAVVNFIKWHNIQTKIT